MAVGTGAGSVPGVEDLTHLPPLLVVACEYDDLRPAADRLVAEARLAGCRVEYELAKGMLHGLLNRPPTLPVVGETLAVMARVVLEADVRSGS